MASDPQITVEGLARLVREIRASVPTIVVHPHDADAVKELANKLWVRPEVEVNEWAVKPGNVVVFIGTKRPITDLGSI